MKILSRMLSKKIDPQAPEDTGFDLSREALDDAGQVRAPRVRSASLQQSIAPKPEEPEVAGSGWAQDGDWDDDWDDDEDWGAEDDPARQLEARRRTEDKQHLVSEIREAMTSVSHIEPEETPMPAAPSGRDWSKDDEFGRRARARSQLEIHADETEDRLMEKTEDVMSDRETSRRRSAMAHMKAAAAATKADRVLRHVASRDAAADPEEQSPYRDDLAKVVRPHATTSRPISRAVVGAEAPTPVWDSGAGDEDAALFAASERGFGADPAETVATEMSAAEELRLSRAPSELSEEDFAADDEDFAMSRTARDFPSSRFAFPADDDDGSAFDDFEHAAEDIAEQSRANTEFDDPFAEESFDEPEDDMLEADTDGPRPSRAVAEAIAFATASDDDFEDEEPQGDVRKKIWEMADEVAAQVQNARAAHEAAFEADAHEDDQEDETPTDTMFEVSTAAIAGRAGRSAGRVKTRLLGFQADEETKDVFANASAHSAPVVADRFPTGWIVVVSGPGRGASFSLHAGVSQIGRGEGQTVRLDFGDTSISRNNHAAVAFDEEQGKFFLGHGGKSNLVRLNGQPVLSTEEMVDGDEIRIGETTLKFIALCGDDFSWTGNGDDGEDA